jgi:site-specific recombinase XerD
MIDLVLNGLTSPHSKRAYERALIDFLVWFRSSGEPAISKAAVQRYATELATAGVGPSSINQRLSAIRKLTQEAADNGLLPDQMARGIQNARGVHQEGKRIGNWLTKEQAQQFISTPDTTTLKGKRDQALLAIMVGCGLRRSEAAGLEMRHIQSRDGRWIVVDLVGKRNKTRSIPMPEWAHRAVEAWATAAGITSGRVFRPVNKTDKVAGDSLTAQAVWNIVEAYAALSGFDIAPHDLRRTFAKLARAGGAEYDQIQFSLGHSSVKTTEGYVGQSQDLVDAPADHLGLEL